MWTAVQILLLTYVVHLLVGETMLERKIKYSPREMRRELAANGVDTHQADWVIGMLLALSYLYVTTVWPMAIHRKRTLGHVIGR